MAIERVKWAKGREAEFTAWLHYEMQNTMGDRSTLKDKWRSDIIQWRARVIGDGVADVPFVGASDLEMPLTAMHVDPVYADFMQTIHVPQDFWSIVGKRPDTVDVAKPMQEFLSRVEKNYLGMRKVNTKAFLDLVIHGTCVYKDYILHGRRKVRNQAGDMVPRLVHQPIVQHVPLEQFLIPAYAYDIDPDAPNGAAPWVAQEFYLRPAELKERSNAESPWLPAYDKDAVATVMSWEEDNTGEREVRETVQQEDQYEPFQSRAITLHEVWARFDADNDGIEEDVVIVWHHKSRTMLRALYSPMLHGRRPFSAVPFLPGLGFYGLGMAELDEWAQLASTRILNNAVDATLLANSIMIGVPAGMNVAPDEPIYPYKFWTLGPNEDLKAIQMGRPYPGALNLLGMFGQWSEQRSGVSELRQGDISALPSRTPAASTQAIMAEGKKRFDMIMGNLREGPLAELGMRVLQNIVQISQDNPQWLGFATEALGPQDAAEVATVLQGPVQDVGAKFGLTVTATSSQVNKEVEKQSLVFLAQLMGQLYPQELQYAQMLGDQAAMLAVAQAAFTGTIELQRRLMEAHDIQNPDMYVPKLAQGGGMATPLGASAGAAPAGAAMAPLGGPQGASPLAQAPQQLGTLLGL